MPLDRLARELHETADQTGAMLDSIVRALNILSNTAIDAHLARAEAATLIVTALQGQDRIEQRCRNMAHAVRQFADLPPDSPLDRHDAIWASLVLDELRLPALSGTAPRPQEPHGDIEFF